MKANIVVVLLVVVMVLGCKKTPLSIDRDIPFSFLSKAKLVYKDSQGSWFEVNENSIKIIASIKSEMASQSGWALVEQHENGDLGTALFRKKDNNTRITLTVWPGQYFDEGRTEEKDRNICKILIFKGN